MQRVVVYGSSGAGKTQLASRLARALGAPHVEIDQLAFDAGRHVDADVLASRFAASVTGDRWVVEGMHRDELSVALARADLFVWLDLARRVVARRLLTRTATHVLTRQPRLGRRATLRDEASFVRKSIGNVARRRRHGRELESAARRAGIDVVRLTTPRAVRRWLSSSARA